MKKLFLAVVFLLGLVGSASAGIDAYGPTGGSVNGREYWFQKGEKQAFINAIHESVKLYGGSVMTCDLQRVMFDGRWKTCRTCGVVSKQSAPEMVSYRPAECR